MVALYLVPSKLPRTITKKEWKELWRWKRVIQKELLKQTQQQIENLTLFGTTHPNLKAQMVDEIINPPLLIGPYMKLENY